MTDPNASTGTRAGTKRRSRSLDVLRCLAILMVFGRHMFPDCPHDQLGLVCAPFDLWARAGWAGVDLFFVLSGFLVSRLLFVEYQRSGSVRLSRFFIRRGLKIYPSFYVLFVVYGLIELKMGSVHEPTRYVHEALFVQNYLRGVWNHTWSLAVEEHFYLAIGCLLWAMAASGRSMRGVPAVGFAVLVGCLLLRILVAPSGTNVLFPTHFRMDALMFGVMLSYASVFNAEALERFLSRWWKYLLIAAAAGLLPLLMYDTISLYIRTIGLTVNYLAFGVIVLVAVRYEDRFSGRVWAVPAAVGANSYSIYLWHMLVKRSLNLVRDRYAPLPYLLEYALYVVFAIVLGMAAAKAIEWPVLRLRDRLWPDAPQPLSAIAADVATVSAG